MNYSPEELNLIALSSVPELSYRERYAALAATTEQGPDLGACKNLLIKRCDIGVYNKVEEKYRSPAFRKKILSELDRRGIECVTCLSADYPSRLKEIHEPPITLFIKGRRELLSTRCFAVVGSRRSPFYALNGCKKFASAISGHFTIVSGCADGADSCALEGASHRAISVIAFGFDHLKSLSNYPLLCKVGEEGLLVSEHFPTVAPQTYLFPIRNRIIAGMATGVLVVSAGKKSGALITAGYAAENGRDVFAFPYAMDVAAGAGCNDLIHDGATLCRNERDVLDFYGIEPAPEKIIRLTGDEERALNIIREEGEIFLPALSDKLGVPPYKLIAVLSSLEIKGLVARLGGNRYAVV